MTEPEVELSAEILDGFPKWAATETVYLGIEEERRDSLVTIYQAQILEKVPMKDRTDEMMKRVYARANLKAIYSAMMLDEVKDSYVIWALSNADEEGWWQYIGGDEEYNDFFDFMKNMISKLTEHDDRGHMTALYNRWSFIIHSMIPALKSLGLPLRDAVRMISINTKLRGGVSFIRPIFERYNAGDMDGSTFYSEVMGFIEGTIYDPDLSTRQLEIIKKHITSDMSPEEIASIKEQVKAGKLGDKNPNRVPQLPPENSAYVMTESNGAGFMITKVENGAQAKAVENRNKGMFDTSQGGEAFFPRDGMSFLSEVKNDMVQGHRDVVRNLMRSDDIKSEMSIVIPINLMDLLEQDESAVLDAIELAIGTQKPQVVNVVNVEIAGYSGKELHLLTHLKIST
jgi:hypothetical protein